MKLKFYEIQMILAQNVIYSMRCVCVFLGQKI